MQNSLSPSLLGVTFSVFDNEKGPQLLYEYPVDCIAKETFENISDFVIVEKYLCGKVIVVNYQGIQFMNCPTSIENTKYDRNTISFAFGMVLDEQTNREPYERVLQKVTDTFVMLELETEFLFQEESKALVEHFLEVFYRQLSSFDEVFIEINPSNIITGKLFTLPTNVPEIHDYDVPMLLINRFVLSSLKWDITIRHIIQFIDGDNCALEIAASPPGMDASIVTRALRTLFHYKCILLTDKLKFTNMYQLTIFGCRVICSFLDSLHATNSSSNNNNNNDNNNGNNGGVVFQTVAKQTIDALITFSLQQPDTPRIATSIVIQFLLQFKPSVNLATILLSFRQHIVGLNIRKFIAYAQYCGILKRQHEYPVDLFHLGQQQETSTIIRDLSQRKSSPSSSFVLDRSGSNTNNAISSSNNNNTNNFGFKNTKGKGDVVAIPLVGKETMDEICLKFKVTPTNITQKTGVTLLFKPASS